MSLCYNGKCFSSFNLFYIYWRLYTARRSVWQKPSVQVFLSTALSRLLQNTTIPWKSDRIFTCRSSVIHVSSYYKCREFLSRHKRFIFCSFHPAMPFNSDASSIDSWPYCLLEWCLQINYQQLERYTFWYSLCYSIQWTVDRANTYRLQYFLLTEGRVAEQLATILLLTQNCTKRTHRAVYNPTKVTTFKTRLTKTRRHC
jgi:hypothetical protein